MSADMRTNWETFHREKILVCKLVACGKKKKRP